VQKLGGGSDKGRRIKESQSLWGGAGLIGGTYSVLKDRRGDKLWNEMKRGVFNLECVERRSGGRIFQRRYGMRLNRTPSGGKVGCRVQAFPA